MRSAVFVLMFAMCLVACGCAGSTDEKEKPEQEKEKEGDNSLTITTTTTQQPPLTQTKQEDPKVLKVPEDSGPVSTPSEKPPTSPSEPEKQSSGSLSPPQPQQQHQKQQQLQLSQNNTNQGTEQSQSVTGNGMTTGHDAALQGGNEDATHTAQDGTPEKDTDTQTHHKEPHVLNKDDKGQRSSSSHSTDLVVEKAQEKQETTTSTTSDNTPAENTSPERTQTEGTQTEQKIPQVSERITTNDKSKLNNITKTRNTTAKEPTQTLSRETDQSSNTGSHVKRQVPSTASTTHTGVASLQQNQDHTKTSLQTFPDGGGLSINKHTPNEGVNTPSSQPAKQKKKDTSGRQQSQAPTQALPNIKNKESANGTTHSATAAAQGDRHSVSPAKPTATTIASDDDVATSKRTTFTNSAWSSVQKTKGDNSENKDTNAEKTLTISTSTVIPTASMQTSVSSTSDSTKVNSAAPQTNIPKIATAIQSLENNDSSIGITSLSGLAVLTAFVMMTVVPAS